MMLDTEPDAELVIISKALDSDNNIENLIKKRRSNLIYASKHLNEQTRDWLNLQLSSSKRKIKKLVVFLDDMGDSSGLRARVDNPLIEIATQAVHNNTSLVGTYQSIMQAPPRVRSQTELAYLFKSFPTDEKLFAEMFLDDAGEEAQNIIKAGLVNKYDYIEVDLIDPYNPVVTRNSDEVLFPSSNTGMLMDMGNGMFVNPNDIPRKRKRKSRKARKRRITYYHFYGSRYCSWKCYSRSCIGRNSMGSFRNISCRRGKISGNT